MLNLTHPVHRAMDNLAVKITPDCKLAQSDNRQVNDLLDGFLDCCSQLQRIGVGLIVVQERIQDAAKSGHRR